MQKQFRYIYNGKEVNKEEFEKLAGDSFKWFEGNSIVSVPFSSFDNFFNGEFKSERQINDHVKEVLSSKVKSEKFKNLEQDILKNQEICNKYFLNSTYKKPQEKNINSTRHKSQNGETHPENLVHVKEVLPSHNSYDNSNYWKHSLENWTDRLVGVKESQSVDKAPIFTYCKVNKNALEALAFRALYGHKKYNKNGEDEDWQNFTRVPNAEEEYANAEFRHALEIGGEETTEEHLIASAWNAVSRLEIFLRNKSK